MCYKVFASFEGASIVFRWSYEVVGDFWDTPKFRVISLGPAKLSSPGFLGFMGCQTSKGGFLLSFKGLVAFTA